jgi:thiol-disulfide isomerase/thioredoxin
MITKSSIIAAAALLTLAACSQQPKLDVSLPDKFEGQTVELMNFLDSTIIASTVVENGKASIQLPDNQPVFASVLIGGRTRAFYVSEPGTAVLNDSTYSADGTPLNDRFSTLLNSLDSIENLNDMSLYLDFVEKTYNDNKDNPLGSYFGIEWMKYADAAAIDSMLNSAPEALRQSPKGKHYYNFARLRAETAPGKNFVDFAGEDENGKPVNFSDFINPDGYTLVDFWASWCPYCIKEIPEMTALRDKWQDKGLKIVGVAVRDVPDDTKAAIQKHSISWPVIFNTGRVPYDIYGFSGIPHHMLIGPDGKIVSRDESLSQIDTRLQKMTSTDQNNGAI